MADFCKCMLAKWGRRINHNCSKPKGLEEARTLGSLGHQPPSGLVLLSIRWFANFVWRCLFGLFT